MKLSHEYQAALDYIYQFVDFSMTKGQVFTPDTFDLSRMKALLDALDNPQLKYPVIHIAGSKGKGSTAAMIASVLRASGYSVGLYTSPHMIDFNERIQINGVPISHPSFVSLLEKYKPVIESVEQITTFEVATALAFQYFANAGVDIAVIEVGLGGRLDATNLVQPLLTVITSISLDHTAILGDTLEKIAFEKGGIIKPGIPVVLAHQCDSVLKNLKLLAVERGSPILSVDEMLQMNQKKTDIYGQQIVVHYQPGIPSKLKLNQEDCIQIWLPLVGKHQMENASTAFLALVWMAANGYSISIEMLLRGFQETDWPGRFEVVSKKPLVIVDSAHNPDSAQRLSQTIQELLPGKKICMIFGASEDKDVEKMISAFRGTINYFIFTESTHPRAMAVGQLEKIGKNLDVHSESSLPIELVVSKICSTLPIDEVCIATGSVFIAAAVKEEMLTICPKHDSTI
jgi:dihydrofolate synthase/folylpolyglutamate synthase